ncbi:molybdenum cofactor guanylyltransferase [Luteibacter yeojuensis]
MADRPGGRHVIVGLVLAGGRSSRMGEDKALMRLDGHTLLERGLSVLRAAGAERVAISGTRAGGIPDRWPEAGPVGGIASAAAGLPDGEWLVIPVDMPRLHEDVLRPLLAASSPTVVSWQGHPLPMRLTMNAATREVLADVMMLAGRERSVFTLQERLGTTRLPLDGIDTRYLLNCNTPQEWREVNA